MSSPTLQPGGVVLLTVRPSAPLVSIDGQAFGRRIRFWQASRDWYALVPADLESKARAYDVSVQGTDREGKTTSGKTSLTLQPKRFETRRLTVEPQFVNPPASEGERIARDATLLASVFAQVSDRLWRGPFESPVTGTATSSFGRLTVLNGESRGRHQGADFRAATGTPVHAPNAGRVAIAEDLYFSGNTVVLDHGLGMFSLLGHLSRIDVTVGVMVRRGELLGESGATGRVTGPHLHWALRLGERSVDPLSLVAALSDLKEPAAVSSPR